MPFKHTTWSTTRHLHMFESITWAIPMENALGERRQRSQTADWGKSLIRTVKRDRQPNTTVSMEPTVLANLGFLNRGVNMKEKNICRIKTQENQSLTNCFTFTNQFLIKTTKFCSFNCHFILLDHIKKCNNSDICIHFTVTVTSKEKSNRRPLPGK